ncbi:SRPBCC family protein [Solirubrobacter soli]|uniref:SRPBCC family protein n=1 Tax=Solirubrobacter soli TaxID=363832 RepID=UPI00041AC045|nr:SRPBCC family protein [Solirubrobacter soli]
MRRTSVIRVVEGSGNEVEQLWHDRSRWASWLDGFASMKKLEDEWPQEGARRVWVTAVGGRGMVMERATAFAAGDGQTVEFEDEKVRGEQRVLFETDGERTRITVTFWFETKERTPPARVWWQRRKLRQGWERSLARFSYELAAERDR